MLVFNNAELDKIIIDESRILSFTWTNEYKDLTFLIDWCGQQDLKDEIDFNNVKTQLIFEFVTEAEFNFKFSEGTMGALEITDFSYKKNEDKNWLIEFHFDFYPQGLIRFNCDDFKCLVESK